MCIYVSKVMRNFAVKKLVAHFFNPFLVVIWLGNFLCQVLQKTNFINLLHFLC